MTTFKETAQQYKEEAINLAFREDSELGDHTSLACISSKAQNGAHLKVKEVGIISGVDIAENLFRKIDPNIVFKKHINDGTQVSPNMIAFEVYGNTQNILRAERVVLNLMQRMSGIATKTDAYVQKLSGTKAKILDTRKTAPCLRYFDKEAVLHGGGCNHRYGLFDMVMIKDNHVDYAGGIKNAIEKTHEYLKNNKLDIPIEIEVRNFDDIKTVLQIGGVDRIMLDNFSVENTFKAVELISGAIPIESSGGITFSTIRDYALCGVDFISVGDLTHNVKGIDLSLKAL